MLKLCGAAAVLGIAVLVSICYREYRNRLIRELDSLCEMLKDLHMSLAMYSKPLRSWAQGYKNELLEEVGLLPRLRAGGSIAEAFDKASPLRISGEGRALLEECFANLGRGYIEDEIARTREVLARLEKIRTSEREQAKRAMRAATAISMGLASGAVIVLL
ncbi:MAG: hypothetical protein IJY24_03130 [Clostridia bacterium]|nr:hypothetical protein [Clostridia bacterium]